MGTSYCAVEYWLHQLHCVKIVRHVSGAAKERGGVMRHDKIIFTRQERGRCFLVILLACGFLLFSLTGCMNADGTKVNDEDPYLWLEEVTGNSALDWVAAQNQRTASRLESDDFFKTFRDEATAVLTAEDRLPLGEIKNGYVYNVWRDDQHVRGIWRRSSLETYLQGDPVWEVLIDFDALARDEQENWVFKSVLCLPPSSLRCMVQLSRGGKDASVWREFDVQRKEFVSDGFNIPEAKTNVAWLGPNVLLVATSLDEHGVNESGYARTIVRIERGQDLDESVKVFEGAYSDSWLFPFVEFGKSERHVFIMRAVTAFDFEYYYSSNGLGALEQLPIPLKADVIGLSGDDIIILLNEDWRFENGEGYHEGDVIAYRAETGSHELVFSPGKMQSVQKVQATPSSVIVQITDNVKGKAVRARRVSENEWRLSPVELPENGVIEIVSAAKEDGSFLATFESLTHPETLYFVDPQDNTELVLSSAPAYDASDVVMMQRFATSRDGAKVPYFVAGKRHVLAKGGAPTIQYGYGGFSLPSLPVYYEEDGRLQHGGLAGRIWISRGGVLVISNIRGGSEYGPRWHREAMKENRQKAFDDFIAVSEDLLASGVSAPGKLGAIGRSNGGLLMGAVLTQRPDLYSAMDIGVPLFDMKRFNKLLAGAQWMSEFGDPDAPSDWAYISEYSPYHNIRPDMPYPDVFFYTSTLDDRTHPGHARKAAARLLEHGYDVYYYENSEGGHSGAANKEQLAHRIALEFTYFARYLELDPEGSNE